MFKRFAIVKLWPDIKAAEDECIARIKNAAEVLGISCVEVHADGTIIGNESERVSYKNVDFVLHLHYDTPKQYDAFSFVALWNPIDFYHEWGYYRTSRNLITHDDFLSCNSESADAHVARMIRNHGTHLPPKFKLFHSTAGVAYQAGLGDEKLIYIGINWEAMGGGKSRHQDVLKALDLTGDLRIYGPKVFQGVKVWAGYESYVNEIPFDGVSVLKEISKCGIALVLSSAAHKASGIMSNRLFESIAAGALVICDENPWAVKHFEDSLLYIDTRCSVDETVIQIKNHLNWAKQNKELALRKVQRAQEIFSSKFSLIQNLNDLYQGLEERKQHLLYVSTNSQLKVNAFYLMPSYCENVLERHTKSISNQNYKNVSSYLVVDKDTSVSDLEKIENKLNGTAALMPIQMREATLLSQLNISRAVGSVLMDILDKNIPCDAVIFIAPNEVLSSTHIGVLAGALSKKSEVSCAASAAIIKNGENEVKDISEIIDFGHIDQIRPPGFGRFIFRCADLPADLNIALPYMHGRAQAILAGDKNIEQLIPATITINTNSPFPSEIGNLDRETEIIRTMSPNSLNILTGFAPKPSPIMAFQRQVETAPIPPANVTIIELIRFMGRNPTWIIEQIRLIKREGILRRLKVFKKVVRI